LKNPFARFYESKKHAGSDAALINTVFRLRLY